VTPRTPESSCSALSDAAAAAASCDDPEASCLNGRAAFRALAAAERPSWCFPGSESPGLAEQALLIVLAPSSSQLGGPAAAAAARGLRRELPRQLQSIGDGLDVEHISFPAECGSPLAGREVLVVRAKHAAFPKLAEQMSLPKQVSGNHFGSGSGRTFWLPYSVDKSSDFIGSDCSDLFFTDAEVYELLQRGVSTLPTRRVQQDFSTEEIASLRNSRPHHIAVVAAERLGVIEGMMVAHDPQRIKELRARWQQWRLFTALPVQELVEYFGPSVVHYFIFMRNYAKWLLFPAALGTLSFGWHWLDELLQGKELSSSSHAQVSTLLLIAWSTLFVEHWKMQTQINRRNISPRREESEDAELLTPLPLDIEAADTRDPQQRDRVHNSLIGIRYAWTISGLFLLFSVTAVVIHVLLLVGDIVEEWSDNILIQNSPLVLYLGVVSVFQQLYTWLATWLTEREGHLMRSEFIKSLTMKSAFFQLINYHGWFLYLAFWRQDLPYLRSQLLIFFTVKQVLGNFLEVIVPMLTAFISGKGKQDIRRVLTGQQRTDSEEENGSSSAQGSQEALKKAAEETFLLPEPAMFDDYLEMSVMFAAVTCYFPVFPLGGLLALLHAIFEGYSDSYKYCNAQRRVVPKQTDELVMEVMIGIFDMISFFGVASSIALIWIENSGSWTGFQLVVVEHLLFFFKAYLSLSIPDVPEWITAEESGCRELLRARSMSAGPDGEVAGEAGDASERQPPSPPRMLEVRPVEAQGLQPRFGGMLRRHPVIRLTHGDRVYNTRLEGEIGRSLSRSRLNSGGVEQPWQVDAAGSPTSEGRVLVLECSWSQPMWFSMPLRPGAGLVAELLSLEWRSIAHGHDYVVLGVATFPAEAISGGDRTAANAQGMSRASEVVRPLVGPGVEPGATLTLGLRCL